MYFRLFRIQRRWTVRYWDTPFEETRALVFLSVDLKFHATMPHDGTQPVTIEACDYGDTDQRNTDASGTLPSLKTARARSC